MKWKTMKIITIIAVIFVIIGVAAKIVIDKLFSFIFLSYIGDIGSEVSDAITAMLDNEGIGLQFGEKSESAGEWEGDLDNSPLDDLRDEEGKLVKNTDVQAGTRDGKMKDGEVQDKEADDDGMNKESGSGKEDEVNGNGGGKVLTAGSGGNSYNDEDIANGNNNGKPGSSMPDSDEQDSDKQSSNKPDGDKQDSDKQDTVQGEDYGNGANNSSKQKADGADNGGSDESSSGGINDGGEGSAPGEEDAAGEKSTGREENTAGGKNDSRGESGNRKENYGGSDGSEAVINITKEKIEEAEKSVSTGDKLKALDIIFRKLQKSDWDILIGLLKKGKLTQDDINTAKRVIKNRVNEEEKELLKGLFNKYEDLVK